MLHGGMSGTILYPGYGSDWMDEMELRQLEDGRWIVEGTVYERMSGFNIPEGCPDQPFGANVPLSCVRNLDSPFSAWPKEETE